MLGQGVGPKGAAHLLEGWVRKKKGRNLLRPLSTWLAVGESAGKEAGSSPSAHARQGFGMKLLLGKQAGLLFGQLSSAQAQAVLRRWVVY